MTTERRYEVHARRTAQTPARCDVPGGVQYRLVGTGLTFVGMMHKVEDLEADACDVRVTDENGERVSPVALLRALTGWAPLSILAAEGEARSRAATVAMAERQADAADRHARDAFAMGDEHGGRASLAVARAHREAAAKAKRTEQGAKSWRQMGKAERDFALDKLGRFDPEIAAAIHEGTASATDIDYVLRDMARAEGAA